VRRILYTRDVPTAHPEAGILVPGVNEIADHELADRLVEAGRASGDYLPEPEREIGDAVGTHRADAPSTEDRPAGAPPARRARKDREE
jgi:hypothetical protein